MQNEHDDADSSLIETMVARIEINDLGDPVRQKEMTDAVEALAGVFGTKIEKGALHVSYDPLAASEKKIEEALRSTGASIKAAAADTETARPYTPKPTNIARAPGEKAHENEHC